MNNTPSMIKIVSKNVGRSSAAYEIALESAFNLDTDILLIQEPYIYKDLSRKIIRKHPLFECFSPVDDWLHRLLVLTYTKKPPVLTYTQICPGRVDDGNNLNGDILCISAQFTNNIPIKIINIYNAPTGAINLGAGLAALSSLSFELSPFTILIGDLNLHHTLWQPSYTASPSSQSDALSMA